MGREITDRFEVAAVCDIDRQRAEEAAEEHGIPRVVTDLAEVLRMDDVDVVDICTPPTCTSRRSCRPWTPASTPSARNHWSAPCAKSTS